MNREEAMAIVREYNDNESIIKHMLAVEAAMRAYARKLGEDEEKWGVVGLLHDFDYARAPNEEHKPDEGHPAWGVKLLREKGVQEDVLQAILGHAEYTGVPRETTMAKALFAVDELTGLIVAVALVRPSKKIGDVKPKSIRKKWKDTRFAAGVNRRDVERGAEELGVQIEEHIQTVLEAMKNIADDLGL